MIRLNSIDKVRKEMESIYNDYKNNKIKERRYRASFYGLSKISEIIRNHELEKRLEELEKYAERQNKKN